MEATHKYEVRAKSTKPRSGVVASDTISESIAFSAPPEFLGERSLWTPEHLFVAAVAGCYVSTFSGIAEASKFNFVSLEVNAEGTLEKETGGWKFSAVRLSPSLGITREQDRERAVRILEKTEKTCLIARSISAQVTLEPLVEVVPERAPSAVGAS